MEPTWDERPIFGRSRGLPWWGAVLLAFGLTLVAAVIDIQRQDTLGKIYQGAYILGCVAAVCLVRRRNLFGPIVQPPLVFALTAVGTVLALAPASPGGGLKTLLFQVALPLTSNFPTMGITTAVVVAIGLGRLFLQRDPDPDGSEDAKPRAAVSPRPDVADDPFDEVPARRPRPSEDERRRVPRPGGRSRPADDPARRAARTDDRPGRSADDRAPRPARDDDRSARRGDPRPAREERPRRDDDRPRPAREDRQPRTSDRHRDGDRPRPPRDRAADPRPRDDRAARPAPKRQPPRRPRPEDR
ncbi:DUF6542 domain-containing protein [Alloactinosynnema sp. L-07]|uniref:DUF6542 domain-containing protein n=1 Tax=Alloactinosynnema sp. L-07 TaxID=1653480 RepID=UPI0006B46BB1|nr:DUF6542 domain-containing protein [Alloactinosynnema sp. L-07]